MSKKVRRLFDQFRPEHYSLVLNPDREAMRFSGKITITGKKTGRPAQRLTLHQSGLKITSATIIRHDKKGDQPVEISRINHHASFNEVRLHTDQPLYPGTYTVELDFNGAITRQMNGIYPCNFEHDGQKKQLIATQFESHHAREVFPCIDEPAAKATFDLTLTTPQNEAVVANTPVKESSVLENGLQRTVFETTPRMSTYLLAFAYGDMDFKEAVTKDGVRVRTYATPDNAQFTDFALDVAVKCLEFYNDYFDTPYPLPKCDLIALPDFASGAMENWGCITFREQCMLVDPDNTSLPTKQYVAMVVAHELAHQWFGNLVTMRWWTDLWLNEGFASWIEYLATDKLFPEWQMWTQFAVDEQQGALRMDALEYTHPIEVTINHPDEIRTIFDAISYNKGSSVINMLENYLGRETFRDGLRHYLKQHAYDNTDTVDLWSALEDVSKKPVKQFMQAWTGQPGFPIVRASATDGALTTTQERFYLNPQANKDSQLWPVPLLASHPLGQELLDTASNVIEPLQPAGNLTLNHGRSGFYHAIYDSNHLQNLAQAVKHGEIEPLDRMGLLSDAFEAAKAGYLSTVEALKLLEAYSDEDNTVVWDVIAAGLGSIRLVMDSDELREAMKPYIRNLVSRQLTRLGWTPKKDETYFDSLLRPTILSLAALADEPEVVKEVHRRFDAMTKPEDLAPDLRAVIYNTTARLGGKEEYDKLLKLHDSAASSEERVTLAAALTNFEQPELINRSLELITSDSVRLQDVAHWVAYSFSNRHARQATWDWVVTHWDWLHTNLGSDLSFYRMPNYAARVSSSLEFLPIFTKFFDSVMQPALERPVKQAVETIQWHAAWKQRDGKDVLDFFKKQKPLNFNKSTR